MPVPLAAIRIGAPANQARAILPREAFEAWSPPQLDGMIVNLVVGHEVGPGGAEKSWISAARVALPRAHAGALIASVWSEPSVVPSSGGEDQLVWLSIDDGLQAVLRDDGDPCLLELEVRGYLPLDRLLDESGDHFGFEPRSYLGLTVDEAMAISPPALRPWKSARGIDLHLPSVVVGDDPDFDETHLALRTENGVVISVTATLPRDLRDVVAAAVAKKGPRFHVEDDGAALIVVQTR